MYSRFWRSGVVAARDAYERSVRDVIADGIARKIFRPVDAKLATFAVLGSINWLARWYRAGGASSAKEVGEAFSDVFLAGLLAK